MKRDKKSTNRANEIVKKSLVFFLAIGLLFGFAGCNLLDIILSEEIDNANNYTEEEHLQRVSELVIMKANFGGRTLMRREWNVRCRMKTEK